MGYGELTEWVIEKIALTRDETNEKCRSNPFGRRRIYIIPLFHHSIIPYVMQDYQASVNICNFNKWYNFRDVITIVYSLMEETHEPEKRTLRYIV
jgi:hypothetical protein